MMERGILKAGTSTEGRRGGAQGKGRKIYLLSLKMVSRVNRISHFCWLADWCVSDLRGRVRRVIKTSGTKHVNLDSAIHSEA